MLAIAQVKNVGYYDELAKEDYYLQGGEPPGQWLGCGAGALGLFGSVEGAALSNVMSGLSPDGKIALCQNSNNSKRVYAYDNVFSPAKSVSVAWAGAEPDERSKIQFAHDQAVKTALLFLEQHAAFTRRGHNGSELEKLPGFLIATYQHSTSREQDPQLHTHALIMNIAERNDGTWGTIIGRNLYAWRTAATAIYQCHLAKELQKLGYTTTLGVNGKSFEIVGVSDAICEHFSKRSAQIKTQLEKYGSVSRASEIGDKVARYSRQKKGKVDRPALFLRWQKELQQLGYDKNALKLVTASAATNIYAEFNTATLLQRLTSSVSVFNETDLYKEAALLAMETGYSGNQAQLLAQHALNNPNLITLQNGIGRSKLFSTTDIIAAETELVNLAINLKKRSFACTIDEKLVHAECAKHQFPLTEEQIISVLEATAANSLAIVQGSAGAGKSLSMKTVKQIYEKQKITVIGACHTRAAAMNLEEQAGISAFTITRLLALLDTKTPPINSGSVLIIDEAGQVGLMDMLQLMRFADKIGFKLLLVGEDKQLDAINHGGVLRYLATHPLIGTTRIETILRQNQHWDRLAVADFRDGRADKAVIEYKKRNQIVIGEHHEHTLDLMLNAWKNYVCNNPSAPYLMMAHRWETVNELNKLAREHLCAIGKIGGESIELRGVISEKPMVFKVAVGERLRLTKNDYQQNYTNGHIGTVLKIQKNSFGHLEIKLRLDNGRTVNIRPSEHCDEHNRAYLIPAYAQTVFSSQGLTVSGETFVYYSTSMDRANTYVACSRHKEKATLFANAEEISEHIPDDAQNLTQDEQMTAGLVECMSLNNRPQLAVDFGHVGTVDLRHKERDQYFSV